MSDRAKMIEFIDDVLRDEVRISFRFSSVFSVSCLFLHQPVLNAQGFWTDAWKHYPDYQRHVFQPGTLQDMERQLRAAGYQDEDPGEFFRNMFIRSPINDASELQGLDSKVFRTHSMKSVCFSDDCRRTMKVRHSANHGRRTMLDRASKRLQ